jgi:protein SCO1/2
VKPGAALIAALLLFPQFAAADLPPLSLESVEARPLPHAHFPLSLAAPDITGQTRTLGDALGGHPGLILFADYTCKMLCGPALVLLGAAIDRSHLSAGSYRVVVIGIDPKDSRKDAAHMRDTQLPSRLRANAVFLLPNSETLKEAADAAGFRFVYDPSADQFAHPELVYLVSADGVVRKLLSPFALTSTDLKLVLNQPPQDSLGLYDRVRIICYRLGTLHGPYTALIEAGLMGGAFLTLIALAAAMLAMHRKKTA